MDVSEILAEHARKQQAITVEKEIPLEVDAGFLTVTDTNPIDEESYKVNLEEYIQSTARDGVQVLISALFSLPTVPSPDGPLAQLPPPTTQLPRAKSLPKPKPLSKWEQFAKAKGISHRKKDRKVWDEEKQQWVNRWGWKGTNKAGEEQWLTEVPQNADIDHDPAKKAREERKARVSKNEKQHEKNMLRAQRAQGSSSAPTDQRKREIDRTLATTRVSTASMGRFDKKLEGEKKLKGVKRKFEAAEVSADTEKLQNMSILSKLDREPATKKAKGGDGVLNVRKAVRAASKGKGSAALAKESGGKKGKKVKR
ncbi:uncharacterized protein PHACADRAFT_249336 [Phanerochaete carnosa HHB-10118-sp]|uniref:Ribosome biogenesis regulatory protein n=1 Tax=Phanerochaete carnosa (strain HHB-10118-sp) TaxID=650164 RepID=K5V8H2_PHACS|nr:uncharacterized protein PHACADRAFT_249336 [Phanerochaete carnosa HHB-10118-sp]EKM59111.1 hypothetical protein PHACADRAFT_249336 [Phanerochaete carnosa HHB-10118-sp]